VFLHVAKIGVSLLEFETLAISEITVRTNQMYGGHTFKSCGDFSHVFEVGAKIFSPCTGGCINNEFLQELL
jgi:hypothetical protein